MRIVGIICRSLFFATAFIILFLYSKSWGVYIHNVYNADLLFPFSLYQGLFNQTSHSDWVFGGYTPFMEITIGLILWLFSRNIHTTFLLYAVIQSILVTLSLIFLAHRVTGSNSKVTSLIVVFSTFPIYLFAFGQLD